MLASSLRLNYTRSPWPLHWASRSREAPLLLMLLRPQQKPDTLCQSELRNPNE